MMKKISALSLAFALVFVLAACGEEAGEETTVSGMVVSVEGTVIQLMDTGNMGNRGQNGNRGQGDSQRPTVPEGFDPENFRRPEGESRPEGERPTMPEGEIPTRPEGETRPQGASGGRFNMEGVETQSIDIANARIAKEIDGGKESASLSDMQPGILVTVTLNSKGEVTYVLITSTGFGGTGGFGGNRRPSGQNAQSVKE